MSLASAVTQQQAHSFPPYTHILYDSQSLTEKHISKESPEIENRLRTEGEAKSALIFLIWVKMC